MSSIQICGEDAEVICARIEDFVDKYKNESEIFKSPKGLEAISDLFAIFNGELSVVMRGKTYQEASE